LILIFSIFTINQHDFYRKPLFNNSFSTTKIIVLIHTKSEIELGRDR